jgi:ArsR family transcriptional regulator
MRDAARFFKLLADEARLGMLWLLSRRGELCVCDLTAALGTTQSKASRHLATLRHAGLVADRRAAAWSYYSLRPVADGLERAALDAMCAHLADRPAAARLERRLDAWLATKARGGCAPAPRRAKRGAR